MVVKDGPGVVGNVGDFGPVCRELGVASKSGEAVGGGVLAVRGGDNGLCYAGTDQIICVCGQPLKEEQMHGHYVCIHCKCITSGCCGDI